MERFEAEKWYRMVLAENREAAVRLREAQDIVRGNDLVLQGLERRWPDLSKLRVANLDNDELSDAGEPMVDVEILDVPDSSAPKPPLREAVMAVLAREPGRWWSTKDLVKALHERGVLPDSADPESAIRQVLRRAEATADAERQKIDGRSFAYRRALTG